MSAASIRWGLLALAGLLAAIAVGVAAASLTSSRIGLSSEPVRAGEALAPPAAKDGGGNHGRGHPEDDASNKPDDSPTPTTVAPTATATAPTTTAPAATSPPQTTPSDDSAGSEGSDDD